MDMNNMVRQIELESRLETTVEVQERETEVGLAGIMGRGKYGGAMCSLAYPEVSCCGRNLRCADMISRVYAGNVSELTAVCQYMYGHFVLKSRYPELSEALSYIAKVEMRHLDILAELICALGGNPRYAENWGPNRIYWNGCMVDYSRTPRMILLCNIDAERKAIADYRRLICNIPDENVKAVLKRIVMDEERHIEILSKFLKVYSQPSDCGGYEMGRRRY